MKKLSVMVLAGVLVGLCACSSESTEEVDVQSLDDYSNEYVTTPAYLYDNLGNSDIKIIDCRGEDAYNKGHIEGSIPMTWQEIADVSGETGDAGWGTVLPADELEVIMAEKGISKDDEIILYTDTYNGWGEDGRILWCLDVAGFTNAKELNGGIEYWTDNNLPTTKDDTTYEPIAVEEYTYDYSKDIDTETLANNYDDYVVLDTRSVGEYEGDVDYGEARGGHLPGAISIPFNDFLNEDGTYKSEADMIAILDENGITQDDEIVSYCTAAIRSGYMTMILDALDYNSINYDESFYRWAAVEELPLEQ